MARFRKKTVLIALVIGLSGAGTRPAHAQAVDSAAAQALFDEAKQLLADGKAAEACPKLEESQRLDPGSGTLVNLASCYEQTSRLASAWSTYLEAASAAKAAGNPERESVARERAAALAPRLSKLVIAVGPALQSMPGLEITRDGIVVRTPQWGLALPADAGEHAVTAKAPGRAPWETKVTVTGETTTETVTIPELAVRAEEPKSGAEQAGTPSGAKPNTGLGTMRTVALVAGGVGVIGVGLGSVFGLQSMSKHDQANKYCASAACTDQRGVSADKDAQSAGNASTAMMIVGGVGLATGVTLWLAAPKRDSAPSAQVGLGPGSLYLKGAW